jgi:predicted DNA-binding protein YlxM (UPF0122 family)
MTTTIIPRRGHPWRNDETNQLMEEIKNKVDIKTIAETHERTSGAIASRLRVIAFELYKEQSKTEDEIQQLTGLSKDQIRDAIKRREDIKTRSNQKLPSRKLKKTELLEMIGDIQVTVHKLLDKLND